MVNFDFEHSKFWEFQVPDALSKIQNFVYVTYWQNLANFVPTS